MTRVGRNGLFDCGSERGGDVVLDLLKGLLDCGLLVEEEEGVEVEEAKGLLEPGVIPEFDMMTVVLRPVSD